MDKSDQATGFEAMARPDKGPATGFITRNAMDKSDQAIAVGLMQMAMTYLDKAGDLATAAVLQHAIDTALKRKPLEPGDVLDPAAACLMAGIPLGD